LNAGPSRPQCFWPRDEWEPRRGSDLE
jgi:hypothetical protein